MKAAKKAVRGPIPRYPSARAATPGEVRNAPPGGKFRIVPDLRGGAEVFTPEGVSAGYFANRALAESTVAFWEGRPQDAPLPEPVEPESVPAPRYARTYIDPNATAARKEVAAA